MDLFKLIPSIRSLLRKQGLGFSQIRGRFVTTALVIQFATLILVITIALWKSTTNFKRQALDSLEVITYSRALHIQTILDRLSRQFSQLADLPFVQTTFKQNRFSLEELNEIKNKILLPAATIWDIAALDPKGRLLGDSPEFFLDSVTLPKDLHSIVEPTILLEPHRGPYESFIEIIPVRSKSDHLLGFIAVAVLTSDFNAFLLDRRGLGDSGETYLVNQAGTPLSSLRFDRLNSDGTVRTWPVERIVEASREASKKKGTASVSGTYLDYRGIWVQGFLVPIANSPWFLIGERDHSEIIGPVWPLAREIIGLEVIIILISFAIFFALGTKLVNPILELERSTKHFFSSHPMKHLTPAANAPEEIVSLIDSVNKMHERIYNSIQKEAQYNVLLSRVVNASSNAVAIYRSNFEIVLVNHAFSSLIPHRSRSYVGENILSLFSHFSPTFISVSTDSNPIQTIRHYIESDTPPHGSDPHFFESILFGEKRLYVVSKQFLQSTPETLFYLSIEDITEMMLLRSGLLDSERMFKDVVENAGDGIVLFDRTLRITYFNRGAEAIFGYGRIEMIAKPFFDLFESSAVFSEIQESRDLFHGEEFGKAREIIGKRKDGTLRALEVGVSPHLSNERITWIAVIRDISERKQNEKLIFDQRQQLLQSSKLSALGELAGGIAHEINTPLSVITGWASYLRGVMEETSMESPDCAEALNKIEQTAYRIAKIIRSLKLLARQDTSTEPLKPHPVLQLVDDALELCRENIRNRQIQLKVDKIPSNLLLTCKSSQITQVLLNLLQNAIDAVTDQKERWIWVQVAENMNDIDLSITDSGNGIAKELREKIFQPFFTTKPVGKGTGLGLSLSYSIIEAHHGFLFIDQESPNTRFVIRISKFLNKSFTSPTDHVS